MKARQAGSAAGWVLVVIVAVLLWWQWDWISGFIGGRGGALQVVSYRCEKGSDGRGSIDGRVTNTSDAPLSVRALTAVYDSSGKKSDYVESPVRPSPVPPGQDAGFGGATGPLPDGGYCKLDGFVDSATGKAVGYSGHRR
ncbi:MAG TPA: hypothetical protein VJS20_11545 [Gemmatimonadales bacterium]|nr:hypothetical protein [Gemmatimonadales bacterium]